MTVHLFPVTNIFSGRRSMSAGTTAGSPSRPSHLPIRFSKDSVQVNSVFASPSTSARRSKRREIPFSSLSANAASRVSSRLGAFRNSKAAEPSSRSRTRFGTNLVPLNAVSRSCPIFSMAATWPAASGYWGRFRTIFPSGILSMVVTTAVVLPLSVPYFTYSIMPTSLGNPAIQHL